MKKIKISLIILIFLLVLSFIIAKNYQPILSAELAINQLNNSNFDYSSSKSIITLLSYSQITIFIFIVICSYYLIKDYIKNKFKKEE